VKTSKLKFNICYGMEINPIYCQLTLDRMRKLDPDIEVVKIDG
jgi:hypothetical protein